MKTLILTLLFSLSLFAQEIITVSRGSGRYLFNPITGSYVTAESYITLYGNVIPTRNDTGATSKQAYLVYKYTGGVFDSLRTLGWNIVDPYEDTTGFYYCSTGYKTQGNYWIYVKGADSTFNIPFYPSIWTTAVALQDSNYLQWADKTKLKKTYIYRATNDGWIYNSNNEDTLLAYFSLYDSSTSTFFYDNNITANSNYSYRLKFKSWNNTLSDYSSIRGVISNATIYGGLQFTQTPFDFGILLQTASDTTMVLRVKNTGTNITLIDSVTEWGDGFTSNAVFPDTIAVGDTNDYNITFDRNQSAGNYTILTVWHLINGTEALTLNAEITLPVPAQMTGLDTTAMGQTTANMGWDNPANETGIRLRYRLSGVTTWDQVNLGANVTSYQLTGLSANTNYTCDVTAFNSSGYGTPSDTLLIHTDAAPQPPAQVTGFDTTSINTNDILTHWTDGSNETNYQLERKLGNQSAASFALIATVNANVVSYNFSSLTAGIYYTFRIRAINAAGNGAYSDTLRVLTDSPPPTVTYIDYTNANAIDQDDMCFWLHPDSPDSSLIITSDKGSYRLFVYDLGGNLLQDISLGWLPGNIDVIYEFILSGVVTDLIAINRRDAVSATADAVYYYKINPTTRQLTTAGSYTVGEDLDQQSYGLSNYRSPYDSSWYTNVTDYRGTIAQYKLQDNAGSITNETGTYLRRWEGGTNLVDDIIEGNVPDHQTGKIYVAFENRYIRVYCAEPDSPTTVQQTFAIVGNDGVLADIEGITIYYNSNGTGKIIFSNQGGNNYKVYPRENPKVLNATLTFTGLTADGDGVDIANYDLSPYFPYGVFLAHAGGGAGALGTAHVIGIPFEQLNLPINTTYWNPRLGITPPPPPSSDSLLNFTNPFIMTSVDSGAGTTIQNFTVTNNSGITISFTVSGLGNGFSTTFTGATLLDGESAQVPISANRSVTPGLKTDAFQVVGLKTQVANVQITINAVVPPPPPGTFTLRSANYYVDAINGSDSYNGQYPFFTSGSNGPWLTLTKVAAMMGSFTNKTIAFRDSMIYRKASGTAIDATASGSRFTNYWIGTNAVPINPNDKKLPSNYKLPVISATNQLTNWTLVSGNIWQCTSSAANTLFFCYQDSIRWGIARSSQGACTKERDFYKTGTTFYVYSPTDPDTRFTSIESSTGVQVAAKFSAQHVTFDHLDVRGGGGYGVVANDIVNSDYATIEYSAIQFNGTSQGMLAGTGAEGINIADANHTRASNNFIYENTHHQVHLYNHTGVAKTDIVVDSNLSVNGHYNHFDINGSGSSTGIKIRYNVAYEEPWTSYRSEPNYTGRNGAFWTNGGIADGEFAYNLIYDLYDATMVHCNVGVLLFNNNTFVQSRPGNTKPIIYVSGGSGSLWKNNIIYAATGGSAGSFPSGSSNNTITNPLFVNFLTTDFTKRDFHLQVTSPAINTGVDLGYVKDLDGNPIVGLPDRGVYERQP